MDGAHRGHRMVLFMVRSPRIHCLCRHRIHGFREIGAGARWPSCCQRAECRDAGSDCQSDPGTPHSGLDLGPPAQGVTIAASARGLDTSPQVSFARFDGFAWVISRLHAQPALGGKRTPDCSGSQRYRTCRGPKVYRAWNRFWPGGDTWMPAS